MKNVCKKSEKNIRSSLKFAGMFCALLGMILSSCGTDRSIQRAGQTGMSGRAVLYSLVFVIHGDGDYLYHDTGGNEYRADENILEKAQMIGRKNPNAEVFIFYQKSKEHFAFIFPLHDGEFFCYRNGQLVATEEYWRDHEGLYLHAEAELYRRFRAADQHPALNMFLYFGHEIPEFGGAGYDASAPDRAFTVRDLANGLQTFTTISSPFDILLLSTCFGGTPLTIGLLGSYAQFIIASPDNLHLSYFDLNEVEQLDLNAYNGDVHAFAEKIAEQSFRRLAENVQTSVSVAVYETDKVKKYVHSVNGIYERLLTAEMGAMKDSMAVFDHCDCAEIPDFVFPEMDRGVEVWYRPAKFGRLPLKQHHSGWECSRAPAVRRIPAAE